MTKMKRRYDLLIVLLIIHNVFTAKLFIGDCGYGFCEQGCKNMRVDVMSCYCFKGYELKGDGRRCEKIPDDNVYSGDSEESGEEATNCDDENGECEGEEKDVTSGEGDTTSKIDISTSLISTLQEHTMSSYLSNYIKMKSAAIDIVTSQATPSSKYIKTTTTSSLNNQQPTSSWIQSSSLKNQQSTSSWIQSSSLNNQQQTSSWIQSSSLNNPQLTSSRISSSSTTAVSRSTFYKRDYTSISRLTAYNVISSSVISSNNIGDTSISALFVEVSSSTTPERALLSSLSTLQPGITSSISLDKTTKIEIGATVSSIATGLSFTSYFNPYGAVQTTSLRLNNSHSRLKAIVQGEVSESISSKVRTISTSLSLQSSTAKDNETNRTATTIDHSTSEILLQTIRSSTTKSASSLSSQSVLLLSNNSKSIKVPNKAKSSELESAIQKGTTSTVTELEEEQTVTTSVKFSIVGGTTTGSEKYVAFTDGVMFTRKLYINPSTEIVKSRSESTVMGKDSVKVLPTQQINTLQSEVVEHTTKVYNSRPTKYEITSSYTIDIFHDQTNKQTKLNYTRKLKNQTGSVQKHHSISKSLREHLTAIVSLPSEFSITKSRQILSTATPNLQGKGKGSILLVPNTLIISIILVAVLKYFIE